MHCKRNLPALVCVADLHEIQIESIASINANDANKLLGQLQRLGTHVSQEWSDSQTMLHVLSGSDDMAVAYGNRFTFAKGLPAFMG